MEANRLEDLDLANQSAGAGQAICVGCVPGWVNHIGAKGLGLFLVKLVPDGGEIDDGRAFGHGVTPFQNAKLTAGFIGRH